ncbi:hypothetical protein FRB95_010361 [Tulasnella sp. JGI-2019a]|nr:hypothetical protein FRB95_010361 [Tulasnella sp. JGI-2019a]
MRGGDEFDDVYSPFLQQLRICILGSTRQLTIGRENFPAISALTLRNVGFRDWDSGLLSGLRYFHLSSVAPHPPSVLQLLDMLVASPRLEQLELLSMKPTVDGASVRNPPILLPSLRNLRFDELPVTTVDVVLRSIHAAYCRIVNVYRCVAGEPGSLFPAIASFFTPSLHHFSTPASEASMLHLGSYSYQFIIVSGETGYDGPTIRASLMPSPFNPDVVAQWIDSLFASQALDLQQLHLGVSFNEQYILDQICVSKWDLRHVETITVRSNGQVGTAFCRLMSSPRDFGNGERTWLGPDVRRIAFYGCKGLDAEVILEMVKNRMAASGGVGTCGIVALEKLEILEASSIADVSFAEIEAGKQQMTCEDVMKAVRRIIAAGTCGDRED